MSLKANRFEELYAELLKEKLSAGLYVVATDIGNRGDITLRALVTLERADLIVCEEYKAGSRLLKHYGLTKPLELLNEHNEKTQSTTLLRRLMKGKEIVALISDCGTPLFADPGNRLVNECLFYKIPVFSRPGASSLTAALMVSGMLNESFLYYGFLPANKTERIKTLKGLRDATTDLIFLETPYRLKALVKDMALIMGKQRRGIIAYRLTYPEEKVHRATLEELVTITENLPKGEFVFILERKYTKKASKEY